MADTPDYEHGEPEPLRKEGATSSHDLVIADLVNLARYVPTDAACGDIAERKAYGMGKYGTVLHRANNRNHGRDATDESGDLVVYLRTWMDSIPENDTERRFERHCVTQIYQRLLWIHVTLTNFRKTGEVYGLLEFKHPPVPHPEDVQK